MDSGVTSKSASLQRPSMEHDDDDDDERGLTSRDEEEERGVNDGSLVSAPPPPPMQEPDPAHPFPFNVIPGTDFELRKSFQASCLSLAARSTRSSCQSLVPTDDEEGEVGLSVQIQPFMGFLFEQFFFS